MEIKWSAFINQTLNLRSRLLRNLILKTLPLLFITGCLQTMEHVNRDLANVNQALKAPTPRHTVGLAPISEAQLSRIEAALNVQNLDNRLVPAVREAVPVISGFIKTNACITDYNGSLLNAYAAPGKVYPSFNYGGAPMQTMKYHNKSSCASVLRFQGWEMPAKNALRFEVVYVADDSGETGKGFHELVKQPSGEWLFTR